MRLSIFTTITNPMERADNYIEALDCYTDLADEVVVVNGGQALNHDWFEKNPGGPDLTYEMKEVMYKWPRAFPWEFIGQQFQRGYEACTGDWVIHADLDFIFHEKDFAAIRKALQDNNDAPAISLLKRQFILPDRFNLKSRLVIAVNKGKYGDRIRFDSGGDLCQPSLDGKYIQPGSVPDIKIPFYNYDFLNKSKAQVQDDIGRMDRAYQRHFGKWLYSEDGTNKSAYDGWLKMMLGRLAKPHEMLPLYNHPRVIQETIKALTPDKCGYSVFGNVEPASYYKGGISV